MTEPLEPAARLTDAELFAIEVEIDWLTALSPTNNHERWEAFQASGYRRAPELTYPELACDPVELRQRLSALPLAEIRHPLIGALLREKARELDRQVDLVDLRGTEGFVAASIALFGAPDPALIAQATEILDTIPPNAPVAADADAHDLARAAEQARAAYRATDPDFDFGIHVRADINSSLMVNHGDLWIDADTTVPRGRIAALIAHEVGTHVVTRHNGRAQPLRQLESGLAHYDPLQEGLAALAEWQAGCLPAWRLRQLSARVTAADAAVKGARLEDIYADLHEGRGLAPHAAFDTAVRAKRGGGLTKDAVYLKGLADLLVWLAEGHDLQPLFAGKFALEHLQSLTALAEEGLVRLPVVMPHHLTAEGCADRLETARATPLTRFFTEDAP